MTARRVWIPRSTWLLLVRDAEGSWPVETGGVLCGYRTDGGDTVIEVASSAGPNAVHGALSYEPDYEFDEQVVAGLYAKSGRTTVYLGDWHSHPAGAAKPSLKDRRALRRIARDGEARQPQPISVIVGVSDGAWTISAYESAASPSWYWPWPQTIELFVLFYS